MIGRPLPASTPCEEFLLSSIMLSGANVLMEAINHGITPESFYHPSNKFIYKKLTELNSRKLDLGLDVLITEMTASGEVDSAGGIKYLIDLSSKVPTSISSKYWIQTIRKYESLRKIINLASEAIEASYSFSSDDDLVSISNLLASASQHTRIQADNKVRRITDFKLPTDSDEDCLLGDRYLCRGHTGMLVGGSGMGKSAIAVQASICWALGRPFLGIKPRVPLKSIHYQSEDEDGDIAEMLISICFKMKLSEDDIKKVGDLVLVKTEKELRGERFIADMQAVATRYAVDIVWVNPLHAFMAGDIKDAESIGKFCREGLNAANRDNRWAYMLVHHTPKPISGEKDRAWNEVMYAAAGSADLVNFCRAVMVLKALSDEGQFDLFLAKRGKRADVYVETESESGIDHLELTTRIPIKHCSDRMRVKGRKKDMAVLFWEARKQKKADSKPDKKDKKPEEPSIGEYLYSVPASSEIGAPFIVCHNAARSINGVSSRRFQAILRDARDKGLLILDGELWKRTPRGDNEVNKFHRETR